MKTRHAVLALSGGMDSTALLLWLYSRGYVCHTISFDYGQKHGIELKRAAANVKYISDTCHLPIHSRVVDIKSVMGLLHSALTTPEVNVPHGFYEAENMKETVVPNRNGIFASILYGTALSIAKKTGDEVSVALGVHSGDHAIYPDCRKNFFLKLFDAFSVGNWDSERIFMELPFIHMNKAGILESAINDIGSLRGLDFDEIFRNTSTSYDPDPEGRPSGKSGSDIERILAFNEIGREDPLDYGRPWNAVLSHAMSVAVAHETAAVE